MASPGEFAIGLFEIGECESCLYSCFVPCMALGQSRRYLDGSGILFNCLCLNTAAFRWMTRSAYGIGEPQQWRWDVLICIFCPCCAINQLLQTTKKYGNPTQDGGKHHNLNDWIQPSENMQVSSCLKMWCCYPCVVGDIVDQTFQMPWMLGFCCVNLCLLRNIMRYQFRIKAIDDFMEDCAYPSMNCLYISAFLLVLPYFCPCYFTSCVLYISQINIQSTESAKRTYTSRHKKAYLRGYKSPESIEKQRATEIAAAEKHAKLLRPIVNTNFGVAGVHDSVTYQPQDIRQQQHNQSTIQKIVVPPSNPYATSDFTLSQADSMLEVPPIPFEVKMHIRNQQGYT